MADESLEINLSYSVSLTTVSRSQQPVRFDGVLAAKTISSSLS
ncbi:hypothetical protein [Pectobacterium versatile]|nr:hypothetical protein [Pectobacterium versatile]